MTQRTPKFYAVLSRMKYITRWALMRNTRPENICEHSQDVAVLAHALALLTNRRFGGRVDVSRCVLIALYHDTPEIFTGDMPTPVKYYNPAIRDAYKQVEDVAADKLLSLLPADLREDYAPLLRPGTNGRRRNGSSRRADKLAALIKCVEELGQGKTANSPPPAPPPRRRSGPMGLPPPDCFLEEFLPAFSLTLDEQDA